jgi:hypothetical protein
VRLAIPNRLIATLPQLSLALLTVWCDAALACSSVTNPARTLFPDTASCQGQQQRRYRPLLGSTPRGSRERSEGRHRNCSFWHEGNLCGRSCLRHVSTRLKSERFRGSTTARRVLLAFVLAAALEAISYLREKRVTSGANGTHYFNVRL